MERLEQRITELEWGVKQQIVQAIEGQGRPDAPVCGQSPHEP